MCILNLVRFKNKAAAEAYSLYLANTLSVVKCLGAGTVNARIAWFAAVSQPGRWILAGPADVSSAAPAASDDEGEDTLPHWDLAFVVEYESKHHFMRMLLCHGWRKGPAVHRRVLEDALLLAASPASGGSVVRLNEEVEDRHAKAE